MSNEHSKSQGGVAPFGYRWVNGSLQIDEKEASVRRLIYDLFLKHRRKKTVARVLNDLGYRTRSASLFSDTTIDRLLRDTTAKGIRLINGKETKVEAIVSIEIWERINGLLSGPKIPKNSFEPFSGIAYCVCGGKMSALTNSPKYKCVDCRRKILKQDLEEIFQSQLKNLSKTENLPELWVRFTLKEKRMIVEHICERIVIDRDTITIRFGIGNISDPFKAVTEKQRTEKGNKTPENAFQDAEIPQISEALLSESEAAKFLGVSQMTMLRKRNANEIRYFKIGNRILYSKEMHLFPFLKKREK